MARNLGAVIGAVLISGSIGCLLDTQPINMKPTVFITPPPTLLRGVSYAFTANANDDGGASHLQYEWGYTTGACPSDHVMVPPGGTFVAGEPTQPFEWDGAGDYCVFVKVTDEQMAFATATVDVRVDGRPPAVMLAPKGPPVTQAMIQPGLVPLYSELRYTASGTQDPDPGDTFTLTWGLMAPDGTSSTPAACADGSGDVCFSVDAPGKYLLSLIATDTDNLTGSSYAPIDVATDQPPCIVGTTPDSSVMGRIRKPADTLTFTVNEVDDDGDPLPPPTDRPSMGSFAWSWRLGTTGAFTRKPSIDLPSFTVPGGTYASGQHLEVRVEAHDRRPTQPEVLTCDANTVDQPVCPWPATSCSQWVTWTVDFQ